MSINETGGASTTKFLRPDHAHDPAKRKNCRKSERQACSSGATSAFKAGPRAPALSLELLSFALVRHRTCFDRCSSLRRTAHQQSHTDYCSNSAGASGLVYTAWEIYSRHGLLNLLSLLPIYHLSYQYGSCYRRFQADQLGGYVEATRRVRVC